MLDLSNKEKEKQEKIDNAKDSGYNKGRVAKQLPPRLSSK